ncbi:thymidylate kinase [Anaeromyxobacter dehalogenans 2CP-1]|uniref:Thymidylate kinase n=1 Tax=Anaeromyxobacter dehalogenans (strain ATCC BAA-258 / DSM 21875 / 2CP-1) TaxID=455488 RepID=B8J5C5_ANAD2|nr:dTMP kinase [Anaeromyxobacter dehalogenans]ACL66787.1 thymidylate kinase [Anaeromyxobacter dehalogenans 2CP-1]
MLVSFEGIDGSGKTALSNLVCERLRGAGREVVHARERGVLATAAARRVRELTRDPRLLELSPRAELFLNLAREAQQLEEVVRPALARGALCVADRSLHSILALAIAGRGLPRAEVEAAVRAASGGTWPDLAVLVDVDPDLARLRKRVGKILEGRADEPGSRKGLAGHGLQVRIREHLAAEAAAAPEAWLRVANEGRSLEALADLVAEAIAARVDGRAPRRPRAAPPTARPRAHAAAQAEAGGLAERFEAALDALAAREPALAAHLLAGIPGRAAHARRVALAARCPAVVARALEGLSDPESHALRWALAGRVPADVAAGLGADASSEAMRLRAALLARAPGPAVAGLVAADGSEAWALRAEALERGGLEGVLRGLAGLGSERAWALRAEGVGQGLWDAVGRGLAGVDGARADAMRAALAAHDGLAALRGTVGVESGPARALRERLFPLAPKRVLRTLAGNAAPWTWPLRERALAATKEALDAVDGMDHPRAWALRAEGVARWPATAVSSLRHLAATARGREIVAAALRAAPASLPVLRNAHAALALAAHAAGPAPLPPAAVEASCTP